MNKYKRTWKQIQRDKKAKERAEILEDIKQIIILISIIAGALLLTIWLS